MKYISYPKTPHDKKRNTKLTLKEIEQIQKDFPFNPNYKLFAEKYHVSPLTIRYWVDPEYKEKTIKRTNIRNLERLKNDPEYRQYREKRNQENFRLRKKSIRFYHAQFKVKARKVANEYTKNNPNKLKQYRKNRHGYMNTYIKKYNAENREIINNKMRRNYRKKFGFRMFFRRVETNLV